VKDLHLAEKLAEEELEALIRRPLPNAVCVGLLDGNFCCGGLFANRMRLKLRGTEGSRLVGFIFALSPRIVATKTKQSVVVAALLTVTKHNMVAL